MEVWRDGERRNGGKIKEQLMNVETSGKEREWREKNRRKKSQLRERGRGEQRRGRGERRDEERKVEGHDGPLKKVDLELQLASQSPQHNTTLASRRRKRSKRRKK